MRRYSREPTFQSLGDLPRCPRPAPTRALTNSSGNPVGKVRAEHARLGSRPSLPVSPRKLLSNLARCTRTAPCAARKNFAPLWPRTRQLQREPCSWLPERDLLQLRPDALLDVRPEPLQVLLERRGPVAQRGLRRGAAFLLRADLGHETTTGESNFATSCEKIGKL